MSKGFATNPRQILLATIVLASFVGVGTRLVWLHVIDRDALLRYVSQARYKIDPLPGRRGDILDANGAKLATSRSLIILAVDPQSLRKEDEAKWPQLAALIGMKPSELARIFNTKTRPVASTSAQNIVRNAVSAPKSATFEYNVTPRDESAPIAASDSETENSDDEDEAPDAAGNRAIRFAKLSDSITESTFTSIKQLNIKGVIGQRVYRRAYPNNSIASHIIGYVDRTERPVTGIERYADFYLHGLNGWLESEKDGKREELAQFRTREVPAADGYSVKLSIDSVVQQIVDEELAAIAAKYEPEKATIIVSDPRTGFILALGNYPSFDLNTYNKLTKEEQGRMRNIAVSDMYEPGSVFKIVAVAGALNEGLVNAGSSFDCTSDSIEYQGKTRKLPREDHNFDHRLTVAEIVAHSSNRGAAQLAMAMGDDRFYGYARAFGFGQLTGFPNLGIESPGMLASPKKWDGLTITRMPMGHSIAATPLQMHQAMTVIASGGVMMRPSIIRQVLDSSGEVVYRFDRREGDRVVSERTAQTVARMLQGVASKEGTAPEAAIKDYEVAGKTGTSQKIVNGRYSEREHVVSFVGFLPATQPRLVISVIVDGADKNCPGGIAYGSKVAAPSFKRVAEQLIRHLDIKPVEPLSPVVPGPKKPASRLALKGSRQ
jgi:cell division protein FtsI/penicillin-binding protein 2